MNHDFSFIVGQLNRIESKIDKLEEGQSALNVKSENHAGILKRNTDSLEEHMRRTDLLEKKLEHVDSHVVKVETTWTNVKIFLSASVIVVSGVWALFQYFIK